jgi:hypothetical protein
MENHGENAAFPSLRLKHLPALVLVRIWHKLARTAPIGHVTRRFRQLFAQNCMPALLPCAGGTELSMSKTRGRMRDCNWEPISHDTIRRTHSRLFPGTVLMHKYLCVSRGGEDQPQSSRRAQRKGPGAGDLGEKPQISNPKSQTRPEGENPKSKNQIPSRVVNFLL